METEINSWKTFWPKEILEVVIQINEDIDQQPGLILMIKTYCFWENKLKMKNLTPSPTYISKFKENGVSATYNISISEYIFLIIIICHHKPLLQENHISLVSKSSQYCQFWNGKGPITQLSPLEYYNWWDMNRLPKDTVKSLIWHLLNGTVGNIGHPRGTWCQNLQIRSK